MLNHERKGALMAIGEIIRDEIIRRDMSQVALAEMAGVHRSQIKRIEKGAVNITIGTLLPILNVLEMGFSIDRLPDDESM